MSVSKRGSGDGDGNKGATETPISSSKRIEPPITKHNDRLADEQSKLAASKSEGSAPKAQKRHETGDDPIGQSPRIEDADVEESVSVAIATPKQDSNTEGASSVLPASIVSQSYDKLLDKISAMEIELASVKSQVSRAPGPLATFGICLSAIGVAAVGISLWLPREFERIDGEFSALNTSVQTNFSSIEAGRNSIAGVGTQISSLSSNVQDLGELQEERATDVAASIASPIPPWGIDDFWEVRLPSDLLAELDQRNFLPRIGYRRIGANEYFFVLEEDFLRLPSTLGSALIDALERRGARVLVDQRRDLRRLPWYWFERGVFCSRTRDELYPSDYAIYDFYCP